MCIPLAEVDKAFYLGWVLNVPILAFLPPDLHHRPYGEIFHFFMPFRPLPIRSRFNVLRARSCHLGDCVAVWMHEPPPCTTLVGLLLPGLSISLVQAWVLLRWPFHSFSVQNFGWAMLPMLQRRQSGHLFTSRTTIYRFSVSTLFLQSHPSTMK